MNEDALRLLVVGSVLAAVATPLPGAAAEPLGRLFFTPAQRSSLDIARSQRTRVTVATEKTEETAAPLPEVISYGGMVRRSDGETTVWINNRAVSDKEAKGGTPRVTQVRPDGAVSLQVPQSGRSVSLKVGQSVELLSGSIDEGYAPRRAPKPEAKVGPKPPSKPAAEAAAASSPSADRAREERERQRDLEDAVRALQEAAASAKPPPVPAEPSQPPSR